MSLIHDSKLRLLLLDGKVDEFNRLTEDEPADLANTDLRMVDLRGANLRHANLRGAYLRTADLRGVNLLYSDMDGASIHGAQIGGALFPRDIPAREIFLSLQQGTRIRAHRDPEPPDPDLPRKSASDCEEPPACDAEAPQGDAKPQSEGPVS